FRRRNVIRDSCHAVGIRHGRYTRNERIQDHLEHSDQRYCRIDFCDEACSVLAAGNGDDLWSGAGRILRRALFIAITAGAGALVRDRGRRGHDNLLLRPRLLRQSYCLPPQLLAIKAVPPKRILVGLAIGLRVLLAIFMDAAEFAAIAVIGIVVRAARIWVERFASPHVFARNFTSITPAEFTGGTHAFAELIMAVIVSVIVVPVIVVAVTIANFE